MNMRTLSIAMTLALSSFTVELNATAFCALRDPIGSIHNLYPEPVTLTSIVKEIGPNEKELLSESLPFTIHRKEFGDHTVYLAKNKETLHGIIHVRSEQSQWGLVEIAWLVDTDMKTMQDYHFQRCRDPMIDTVTAKKFISKIQGKTVPELLKMLTTDGRSIASDDLSVDEEAKPLAAALIRSAIKTLIVTENVYGDEVRKHQN